MQIGARWPAVAPHAFWVCFSARTHNALLCAASLAALAVPAIAQDQNQDRVETVVVTGTLLHRETSSPVTVISKDEIENAGLTSVADVVRSLSIDNSGTIPTAFANGFAGGSSGVALRGLTVNSTLVLIDGLRTANYPLSDDGQRAFVDLNTIPLAPVERIDVFRDGASSTYGADAIAGVVNIILKRDFQGDAGEVEVGTSQHGGGTIGRATATFGTGDPSTDNYNAYISFDYQLDEAIKAGQRGFPFDTQDLSTIGGLDLNAGDPALGLGSIYGSVTPAMLTDPNDVTTGVALPGAVSQPLRPCGPKAVQKTNDGNVFCEQDMALYNTVQPNQSRFGIYARSTFYPDAMTTAYVDASYFQSDIASTGSPFQIQSGTPHNTNSIALPAKLPNGELNPNDPFASLGDAALINYAFGDIPNETYYDNHVIRAVAELQGSLWNWDYEAQLTAAHSWLNASLNGLIRYDQLVSDVVNGTYNFVDPSQNSAVVRRALSPAADTTPTSDLDEAVVRANRDLWPLPGGPMAVGAGAEVRYEANANPDFNPDGQYQGFGLVHAFGHHTVFSVYGEALAPVISTVEIDLSGRYDRYSDSGGNFSPKVGVKWTPVEPVTLRGTYSEGFRAPSFAENGSSVAEGGIFYTPPENFQREHGFDGYVQPYGLLFLNSANPDVKPETSRSVTVGTVLSPLSDSALVLSIDYYGIAKNNVISPNDPFSALNAYFSGQPIPPGFEITFDHPDTRFPKAPLRPLLVASPYINADSLFTDGLDVDVTATAELPVSFPVAWTGELNVTDIFDYTFTFPGQPPLSYLGLQSPYVLSSGAGTPRWRWLLSNTFIWLNLSVTGVLYYTSGLREYGVDTNGPGTTLPFCLYPLGMNCKMNSFWNFDLTSRYKVNANLEVYASIKNLFDASPPLDAADYAAVNYNPTYAQAGIVGRFFSVGVRVAY